MWLFTVFSIGVAILVCETARVPAFRGLREPHRSRGPSPSLSAPFVTKMDCSSQQSQNILHPHPTSCALYLQCVYGLPMERPCALGTEFSPSIGVCVHPWQSDCTAGKQPDAPESTDEPEESEQVSEQASTVTEEESESNVGDTSDKPKVLEDTETPEKSEEITEKSSEQPEVTQNSRKTKESTTIDVKKTVSTEKTTAIEASADEIFATEEPSIPKFNFGIFFNI